MKLFYGVGGKEASVSPYGNGNHRYLRTFVKSKDLNTIIKK